ncbi:hypothetical protein K7X08_002437 [Anisodus acutangulus]|uniref:K-box domain-containing protein n=1 Tax=Anisodus acutangulus TaxID=402998 RepID=A0A9Q1LRS9_9SOLA|nr:hypothetical protein K7X08_002437 [Anisodus acutangulus]
MSEIISKYLHTTGASLPVHDHRVELYDEITKMKNDTLNLQLSLQRYKGDDLNSAQYEELNELEKQLENALNKIRARKLQLMQQQMENLKRTEKMMEKENQDMYQWLMNYQMYKQVDPNAVMEQHDDQQQQHEEAITELNLLGEQPLLAQFSFFGEEQLGAASTSNFAYRLQPSHPNLQHPDLPGTSYVQSQQSGSFFVVISTKTLCSISTPLRWIGSWSPLVSH